MHLQLKGTKAKILKPTRRRIAHYQQGKTTPVIWIFASKNGRQTQ